MAKAQIVSIKAKKCFLSIDNETPTIPDGIFDEKNRIYLKTTFRSEILESGIMSSGLLRLSGTETEGWSKPTDRLGLSRERK